MILYRILILVALYIIPGSFQGFLISQEPKFVVNKTGNPVELHCRHNDNTYFAMFWYQQKPNQGLKLMVYSTGAQDGKMEDEFNSWTLDRSETTRATLKLPDPKAEHSAVYFCAASKSRVNYQAYFGDGTVLSVLEKDEKIIPPKVTIYRPSKQEIKVHRFISLVCVASDFFPEHVKITWLVNGFERINLYEPVPEKKTTDKKTDKVLYSTSKRLTLTKEEYFNPESTFKCVAAFLDGNGTDTAEVKGEADCSISKETYTIHVNQGKISYIMILCKSGLYALVVLALLWRKKVIANSY